VDAAGHVTYSDQPTMSNSPLDTQPGNDGSALAGMSASTAPPPLPTSDQPPCPEEGDLWTPGYWAWNGVAYYWVPGVWVPPPSVGVLWTPGYWAYAGTVFVFHRGYWGPLVGYYGGINYGFGYPGIGYAGGRWLGNAFAYNRAVNNVNASVFRHIYDEPVVSHAGFSRVSYNGGPGGTSNVPTAQERLAAQSRLPLVSQRVHLQAARDAAPSAPSSTAQSARVVKPVVSHPPAVSAPRRLTPSPVPRRHTAVNTAIRPTAARTPRPPVTPAIKSTAIK
jgi:WXXGXW repeat (2 copies)